MAIVGPPLIKPGKRAQVERLDDGRVAVWFNENGGQKGFSAYTETQFLALLDAISTFVIAEIQTPPKPIQQDVA